MSNNKGKRYSKDERKLGSSLSRGEAIEWNQHYITFEKGNELVELAACWPHDRRKCFSLRCRQRLLGTSTPKNCVREDPPTHTRVFIVY